MKYVIGVGILLPEDIYNSVTGLQLKVNDKFSDSINPVLNQPPHITVKRPFVIDGKDKLDGFISKVDELIGKVSLSVRYEGAGNFEDGTVYLSVSKDESLLHIHSELLELCAEYGVAPDGFEAANFKPHTSVSSETPEDVVGSMIGIVESDPVSSAGFKPENAGIFLKSATDSWTVIHESRLKTF